MILFSSVQVKYDELYTLFSSNIMSYDEYAEMITLRDLYTEILMLKRKAHFDFDEELKTGIRLLQEKILNRKAGLQSPLSGSGIIPGCVMLLYNICWMKQTLHSHYYSRQYKTGGSIKIL